MVRVGIVDDHESVRLGLQAACRDAGYDVLATGPTVSAVLEAMADADPDVIVLDLSLGDGSSITENVKRVQATGAGVLVHAAALVAFALRSSAAPPTGLGPALSFAGLVLALTLLIAGNETTTALIGNTFAALIENPEQWDRVRADHSLIPQLIEEVLRYYSPPHAVLRQATQDAEVAGVMIPKDALVLPLIGSANRDARKFPSGDTFDISRDTKGHIAFGADLHACLGSALARVEARCILSEMFKRLPNLRAKDTNLQWLPSLQMRALQHLEMLTR